MAGIHTKNILAPKNIKHAEITQGHSHIKIVFQDSLRVSHWEEESLEHLALKFSGAWVQSFHKAWRKRDSTFGRCTKDITCFGTKSKDDLCENLTWGLGESSGKAKVSCSSLYGQGHWWQRTQRILISVNSPGGSLFQHLDLAPPISLQSPELEHIGRTTSKIGT